MTDRTRKYLGFSLTGVIIASTIAILNMGVVPASSAACPRSGDGEQAEPTPSGSGTTSSSPSESDGGLPITLPPPVGEESSASPSGSSTPAGRSPDRPRCRSNISINYDEARRGRDRFKGNVRSPHDACEPNRLVFLKKKRKGRDAFVGRDRTTGKGKWLIREHRAKGRFYARVKKARLKTGVVCAGDRSTTIRARK